MKEIWKDIEGYEGLYQVSNLGRVKSLVKTNNVYKIKYKRELIMKLQVGTQGYYQCRLNKNKKGKTYKVHKLVAKSFINNPNNYLCINHKDGNKQNNCVDNLEWCTYSYNSKHAYNIGLHKKISVNKGKFGKESPKHKIILQLTLDDKIIARYYGAEEAKRITNIDSSAIHKVCRGKLKQTGGYHWRYE